MSTLGDLSVEIPGLIAEAKVRWKESPTEPDFFHLRGLKSGRKGNGSADQLSKVTGDYWLPEWQYHLLQMLLSDDPETYLLEHPPLDTKP